MKKFKNFLWIFFYLILLSGCATVLATEPIEDRSYLTPIPESTLFAYRVGTPITNKVHAVIAARVVILNLMRIESVQTPDVIFTERMTLAEAKQKVEKPGVESNVGIPGDTPVWFVIFKGVWQFHPLAPAQTVTPPSPYSGCQYVWIVENNDGYSATGNIDCGEQ